MLFGTDVEMLSALGPIPGQTSLLTAGNMNSTRRDGTEILPAQSDGHMAMPNPLEWPAQLFAVDFEM